MRLSLVQLLDGNLVQRPSTGYQLAAKQMGRALGQWFLDRKHNGSQKCKKVFPVRGHIRCSSSGYDGSISPFLIALPVPQSLKDHFEQDSHVTHHLGRVVFFLGNYVEKHVEACPSPGHAGERGALRSITMNNGSGGMEFQLSYFKS